MHGTTVKKSAICVCPTNINLFYFYYVCIFTDLSLVLIAMIYCDRRSLSPAASVIGTQDYGAVHSSFLPRFEVILPVFLSFQQLIYTGELENGECKVMRSGVFEYAAGEGSSAFEPNFKSC